MTNTKRMIALIIRFTVRYCLKLWSGLYRNDLDNKSKVKDNKDEYDEWFPHE